MRSLLFMLLLFITSQVHASDYVNFGIPEKNRDAVLRVINDFSNECSDYQNNANELPLVVTSESFKQISLLQSKSEITVLTASFECPGFGHPWCGSSGCPTYLIIEDSVYEVVRGYPHPFDISDASTVLINWHGGNYCETVTGVPYSNSGACFSSIYWDDSTKTFVVFNGLDVLKKIF